ncbi:MAG: histidine phosphatase family protein [Blautia sp.]|nr:histidine phosphatase family protein [Blautia sp.]
MKLLIIRHGDPDYEKDSLTEKGWREAALLAERMGKMEITDFYVSPLGRARDTASLTLEKMGRTATECDWLQEFPPRILRPDMAPGRIIAWDWLPQDWTAEPAYFDKDRWASTEIMREGHVGEVYDKVVQGLDGVLAEHGYIRDDALYRTQKGNRDVLAFFCHFGVECVLLSHLMNVSPMILWHHMCAAPSSVTTVYTEERREGKAVFRVSSFGDISHLYAGEEEPAFSARFCEIYGSEDRHD